MKYLILILLCALTCNGIAQAPAEKALLWKITGNGLMAPSYLYGTFHLLCPHDLVVDAGIKQAFAQTKQLYLEIDMSDQGALAMEMMKLMKMKNDQHLNKLLAKSDYDSVATLFKAKTGFPLEMLGTTKPMLLTAMLYPSMMGCQPESWEQTFLKMSEGRNMKKGGLETAAFQMSVLDSIPYQEQAQSLKTTLYRFDSMKQVMRSMITLYKSRDIRKMNAAITADKEIGQYESVLLNKRNASWIPVIKQQMKIAPTFFAVGAGHLAGTKGVINLLRQSGYRVLAVK